MARRPALTEIETFPEADRFEPFPHPRLTNSVVGHHTAIETLQHAFDAARMHHACLLTGPEGIGKATLAYAFAKYALAEAGERSTSPAGLQVHPNSTANHQVGTLSHPGLLVLRRAYDIKNKRMPTTISVDEVRRLRGFLMHRSANDGWRVVIVDRADELNVNAANALLKSLEEPPARSVFFLISNEPGRILTTIRSRCYHLHLSPLANEDVIEAARSAAKAADEPVSDDVDWEALVKSAGGSVRRLLSLSQENGAGMAEAVNAFYASIVARRKAASDHILADKLSAVREQPQYEVFMQLLLEKLASLIRIRAGGEGASTDRELAMQLIQPGALVSWVELWETLHRDQTDIQLLNLDRASFLLDAMNRIRRAAAATTR